MLYLSYDVVLGVFQCLNNNNLQRVRQAFPELDWIEESEKRRSARKIVPFLKKHFPKNDRERALNRGLMKLFKRINEDFVGDIYEISIGRWGTGTGRRRTGIGAREPGLWILHYYKKTSGVWYDDMVGRDETGRIRTHIRIPIEKLKQTILHDKHRIDYITVRSNVNKIRADRLYVSDLMKKEWIYF